MNWNKIQRDAHKLYLDAKSGTAKINGVEYAVLFDKYLGIYIITDATGNEIVRFNTRKISVAKSWLKEWLQN